jgi:hypothetical protein
MTASHTLQRRRASIASIIVVIGAAAVIITATFITVELLQLGTGLR